MAKPGVGLAGELIPVLQKHYTSTTLNQPRSLNSANVVLAGIFSTSPRKRERASSARVGFFSSASIRVFTVVFVWGLFFPRVKGQAVAAMVQLRLRLR